MSDKLFARHHHGPVEELNVVPDSVYTKLWLSKITEHCTRCDGTGVRVVSAKHSYQFMFCADCHGTGRRVRGAYDERRSGEQREDEP